MDDEALRARVRQAVRSVLDMKGITAEDAAARLLNWAAAEAGIPRDMPPEQPPPPDELERLRREVAQLQADAATVHQHYEGTIAELSEDLVRQRSAEAGAVGVLAEQLDRERTNAARLATLLEDERRRAARVEQRLADEIARLRRDLERAHAQLREALEGPTVKEVLAAMLVDRPGPAAT